MPTLRCQAQQKKQRHAAKIPKETTSQDVEKTIQTCLIPTPATTRPAIQHESLTGTICGDSTSIPSLDERPGNTQDHPD
ncbi:hypothetical protein JYU22_04705 [Gammaproteobacteria bacterium AH-315-E17]|nr:hypothetical protein [Gammaproteobacteria bacterium AH-315-E17]